MEIIKTYINFGARGIEALGVVVIGLGMILAFGRYLAIRARVDDPYKRLRQGIGKAILLGLEILVAADIIATVVTEPTLNRVLALGVVVLIRTFLSLSLEVELEGKFPWQDKAPTASARAGERMNTDPA